MILFINPISENIEISRVEYLGEGGEVVEVRQKVSIPRGRDYDELPEVLVDMIDRHNIDTIWCIVGPGAFTRMRIVTLTLNTLILTRNISIRGAHFFDIIDSPHPILQANDSEYIILSKTGIPTLCDQSHIDDAVIYTGYVKENDFTARKNSIEYREDFLYIRKVFESLPEARSLSPIYLKDPHITWSKKSTFLSGGTTSR